MALYHQLKFPSTFIEYRSVSEWKGVVVISNFDSLEAAPSKIYRARQLPSLPRPKFAPDIYHLRMPLTAVCPGAAREPARSNGFGPLQ